MRQFCRPVGDSDIKGKSSAIISDLNFGLPGLLVLLYWDQK